MASMHITPEIEKKLKEYEKKFGVEFLPFLADTGDGSDEGLIAAIDRQIKSGVPQEVRDYSGEFY